MKDFNFQLIALLKGPTLRFDGSPLLYFVQIYLAVVCDKLLGENAYLILDGQLEFIYFRDTDTYISPITKIQVFMTDKELFLKSRIQISQYAGRILNKIAKYINKIYVR